MPEVMAKRMPASRSFGKDFEKIQRCAHGAIMQKVPGSANAEAEAFSPRRVLRRFYGGGLLRCRALRAAASLVTSQVTA